MNEKVYTAWFPQCCAPTLITRDMAEMARLPARARQDRGQAAARHGRALDLRAGAGRPERARGVRDAHRLRQRFAIAQRYLPEIAESGDSRVLLIDGEPVPYALARIPSADDHRGNLAAGARGVGRPLNDRDRWLAGQIGPALAAQGHAVRGPRRDRRLRHRDQRHEPHRHPRARQAVRHTHRRPADGRHRAAPRPRARPARGAAAAQRPGGDRCMARAGAHAAGRQGPGLGPPAHHAVPGRRCCTASSSSASPSTPPPATRAARRGWRCCWSRTSFRRPTAIDTATYLAQRTQVGSGNTQRVRGAAQPRLRSAGTAPRRHPRRATRSRTAANAAGSPDEHVLDHHAPGARRCAISPTAAAARRCEPAAAPRSAAGRTARTRG